MRKRFCSESKGGTYMTDKHFGSKIFLSESTLWYTLLELGFELYYESVWILTLLCDQWIFHTALLSWTLAYSQTTLNPCVPILLKGFSKVFMYRASMRFFIFHSSSNITTRLAKSPIVVHYLPCHLALIKFVHQSWGITCILTTIPKHAGNV